MIKHSKVIMVIGLVVAGLILGAALQLAYTQSPQEYIRIRIDVAIPRSTWQGLSAAQKQNIRDRLLQLKAAARKINEGNANKEDTTQIKWHICEHEMGLPCDMEQDLTDTNP